MLNVAIVDDEEAERKRISDCLEYVAQKKKVEFAVREFSSADIFLIDYEYLSGFGLPLAFQPDTPLSHVKRLSRHKPSFVRD